MKLEYNNHNIPFNSTVKFQGVELSKVVFNDAKVWEKITPFTLSVSGDWGSTLMVEAEDPMHLYVPMTGAGARIPYVGINDTSDHWLTLSRAFSKPLSFKAFVNIEPTSFFLGGADNERIASRNLVITNPRITYVGSTVGLACPSVNSLADLGLSLTSPQQVFNSLRYWVTVDRDLFPPFAAGQTQFRTNLDDDEHEYSCMYNDTMRSTLADHGITAQRIFDLYPPTFASANFSGVTTEIYDDFMNLYHLYAVVHNNSYDTRLQRIQDYSLSNVQLHITDRDAIAAWQQATTDAAKFAWLQRFVTLSYVLPGEDEDVDPDKELTKQLAFCVRATSFYLEATDGEYTWRTDNLQLAFGELTFNPVFS